MKFDPVGIESFAMKNIFFLLITLNLIFLNSILAKPNVGETVEVDNYDGTGKNEPYMGTFKISKIDNEGHYFGNWVKVPSYYKLEGKKPSTSVSCEYIISCKAELENAEAEFKSKQASLESELDPDSYLKKYLNNEMFKLNKDLSPGESVEVCFWPNENLPCGPEDSSTNFIPAKVIRKTSNGYEVNARIFDGSFIGTKPNFKDKKMEFEVSNIRYIDPSGAAGTEITEDMAKYEVVRPGTLVDVKCNGKWYRALVTTKVGYADVSVVYVNWGNTSGYLQIKSPLYEFAPFGSKTKSDTGAFSGMPYPYDNRGYSKVDMSQLKKNNKCPTSMPFVSNGICVDQNGQWKGARPIRP